MTLCRRLIVCLDVTGDRVVKGVRFADLRDVGDPVALAARYEAEGADEIVFLDVSATIEQRTTLLECVRRTAERLFIPLTVGGGIRSVDDASAALRAGADKVGVNSAAVARPALLSEMAAQFGAQCVVASIDAKRRAEGWEVYVRGGSIPAGLDAVEWARECVDRGAGCGAPGGPVRPALAVLLLDQAGADPHPPAARHRREGVTGAAALEVSGGFERAEEKAGRFRRQLERGCQGVGGKGTGVERVKKPEFGGNGDRPSHERRMKGVVHRERQKAES